jgi:hypothetical protein
LAKTRYISKPVVECELASLCLRYLTLDFFDNDLDKAVINQRIVDGWLSFQDYAVSKWFQHLHALAQVYNEEGFKVGDSYAALQSLYDSMTVFLDRYADEISDEELQNSIKDDYAKLIGCEIYDDLTRVMGHVTRYMEKGANFRNEICIESLSSAFERNRTIIEKLSTESSRNSPGRKALVRFYGPKHFKCSFVTCIHFYEGFTDARTREKHVNKHNRPWVCEVPHCTMASLGFTSNNELDKHMKDFHPDKCDLSVIFNITPRKVIETSKHVCHICGKHFSRKFHKEGHIRSHMGDKPFACSECGKAFTRDNDRKRHEKTHDRR